MTRPSFFAVAALPHAASSALISASSGSRFFLGIATLSMMGLGALNRPGLSLGLGATKFGQKPGGLHQIPGAAAFGKPVVDRRQHGKRFGPIAAAGQHTPERRCP